MRRLLIALALTLSVGCAGKGRTPLARSWILGKPLDLGVANLAGDPVAVGGPDRSVRVVVLWATWCRSCYTLFPALDLVAAGTVPGRVSIFAISVDEDLEKVREALPRLPQRVQVLRDRGAERLGERLGIEELPMILVLDRAGVVQFVHDGTDDRLLRQVDAEVRRLLRD